MQNLTLLLTQAIINASLVTNSTDIEAVCWGVGCKIIPGKLSHLWWAWKIRSAIKDYKHRSVSILDFLFHHPCTQIIHTKVYLLPAVFVAAFLFWLFKSLSAEFCFCSQCLDPRLPLWKEVISQELYPILFAFEYRFEKPSAIRRREVGLVQSAQALY